MKSSELLRDNPRGILLNRDELAGWFCNLDKDGHEGDRAAFLEAWNGDGAFTFDRIGRGTVRIEAMCVSILGTIQPGVIAAHINGALSGGNGDDGLAQRFQLMVYPDEVSSGVIVDESPNVDARRAVEALMRLIDESDLAALGGEKVFDETSRVFHFADDLPQPLFFDFYTKLQSQASLWR